MTMTDEQALAAINLAAAKLESEGFDLTAARLREARAHIAARLASGGGEAAITDEMVERGCKRYAFRADGATFPDAYSEYEVLAERHLMRDFLTHVLTATTPPAAAVELSPEAIIQAVARGWTHEGNTHKEMDVVLAEAIAAEVWALTRSAHKPADSAAIDAANKENAP